jgi:hypothetical protein
VSNDTRFNWRCFFGLHPWGKWGAVEVGSWVNRTTRNGDVVAERARPWQYQERECLKCGQQQTRDALP